MKFSIGQKVYLGFGVALLILVVISIVSYRSAIKSIETARWVEHTHTVLVSLEHLLLVAKDAESGVRGYVITGNASYLEPYQTAIQEIDQKVMDLRRLTSDNPHQQRRLDALEPLIAERVAFSRETVDILKNRGIEEAIRVVQTGRGKRLMDGIRRGILEMEDEERTLLKQRLEEAEGSVRQTLAVIASGGLLAFALVALSVLIIHREIAERMRTEEGLRRQALTFQNMHDSVVITDLERRVMDWNPAAERMFGYSRQEALGKPVEVLQKPEEATALTAKITEEIRREGRWSGEITFVRKDGTEGVSETVIVPLLDRQGRLIATIGVNRDITRRKQAEIELQKAKEAAEAASRAKSEFLANMSHEIRTPMNGVIGMTELMLDTALTPAQRSYLEMVKSSAYALLNVINDVLDFSKIEAGKLDLEPIDFNLRDSLGDTMRPLALRAHQKGLELIYHVHADVPDALTGDAGRLQQILINLVGNAIKFTEKGEVVVVVEKQGSGVRGQKRVKNPAAELRGIKTQNP
ncbi:MAG: PAS domain S-box protein [Candidatus Latescibacteria bacterium]|nr:PAS domain S-box protein [Candidatus Latescibacterota bacterium]